VRADDVLLTIDVVISFCFWRPLTQARSRYAFTSRWYYWTPHLPVCRKPTLCTPCDVSATERRW